MHAGRKSVTDTFRVGAYVGTDQVERDMRPGSKIVGLRSDGEIISGYPYRWGAGDQLAYNARLETVETKPYWKLAWNERRRLIIPVARFKEGRSWFVPKEPKPLAIAGLWGTWSGAERDPEAVMLTTASAGPVLSWHERMPVLLTEDLWEPWLAKRRIEVPVLQASSVVMALEELAAA